MIGLGPIMVGSYKACRTARRPTLTGGGGGEGTFYFWPPPPPGWTGRCLFNSILALFLFSEHHEARGAKYGIMYYVVSYCQSGKLPLMPYIWQFSPLAIYLLNISSGLVFFFCFFDPSARKVVDFSTLLLGHVFWSTPKRIFWNNNIDQCKTNAIQMQFTTL